MALEPRATARTTPKANLVRASIRLVSTDYLDGARLLHVDDGQARAKRRVVRGHAENGLIGPRVPGHDPEPARFELRTLGRNGDPDDFTRPESVLSFLKQHDNCRIPVRPGQCLLLTMPVHGAIGPKESRRTNQSENQQETEKGNSNRSGDLSGPSVSIAWSQSEQRTYLTLKSLVKTVLPPSLAAISMVSLCGPAGKSGI